VGEFLKAIRESELNACIKGAQVHDVPPLTDVKGFEIRFP
jgi:hypothetical protein